MVRRTFSEREEELLGIELVLTKLDAARTQLHMAVELFFSNADPISVFTLVSAAHGVLRDIASARDIKKSFKDSPLIADSERAAYLKAVHAPQNFFKHANNDPNGRIAFRYKLTPLLILDAAVLWVALGEDLTWQLKVFLMWAQLEFPDLLCYPPAEEFLQSIRATTTSPESFRLLGLELLRKGEEVGGL